MRPTPGVCLDPRNFWGSQERFIPTVFLRDQAGDTSLMVIPEGRVWATCGFLIKTYSGLSGLYHGLLEP